MKLLQLYYKQDQAIEEASFEESRMSALTELTERKQRKNEMLQAREEHGEELFGADTLEYLNHEVRRGD